MSHNQSRAERSESTQYRKTGQSGSSNQQRHFSGGVFTKGGGGASSAPSNPFNRSAKKYNSNAPGGQSRARSPNVSSGSSNSSASHAVHNGAYEQKPTYNEPVTSSTSNVKPTDAPTQKISRAVPRAPSSNASAAASSNISTASSESNPTTPAKSSDNASRSFPLQFGSISPGFMNGMQIPARTSSAPPNLDEQKKDQARHDSLRAAPAIPIPSIPKQHFPKKDVWILDQPNAGETQPVPKSRRDTQVSAERVTQTQKPSVLTISGMPMQLPFPQPQVAVQFGCPNPQIQSQPMSGTSLAMPMSIPMPMPLPNGNPPVHQPMFVSGLQPLPMQSQGMMHQGQTLNFSSQMGPQLPPQLGMEMNMVPQFPPQQAGKYSGSRKTVKIIHPETREELRLDGSPGPRSHSFVPPQSQPITSFPPNHPINFYPTSFNATSHFFPAASSVPLNSTEVPPTSLPLKFYNQVTVKPAVGSHGEKELFPPISSLSAGKADSLKPSKLQVENLVRSQKEIRPSTSSSFPQAKLGLDTSFTSASSSGPVNVESYVPNTSASAAMDGFALRSACSAEEASNVVVVPDSIKDKLKKSDNRGQQDRVGRQSIPLSSLPSQLSEAEAVEAKFTSSRTNVAKSAVPRAKKKKKELYRKAEAAGTSSDIHMAYKGSEEKKETATSAEDTENTSSISVKQTSADVPQENATSGEKPSQSKVEPDDWEDAAEIPTPQFETSKSENQGNDGDGVMTKRYSRDFLLKILKQCTDCSEAFELTSDIADALMVSSVHLSSESYPSPGRNIDVPRGKKKKNIYIYRKAVAAGTSSDIYMAYKGPEEKKETAISAEDTENTSSISVRQISADVPQENAVSGEKPAQSKVEPDDWEDAANIPTPQFETSKNENQGNDGDGLMTKRYSQDFLL